jgi:hypothetical protein
VHPASSTEIGSDDLSIARVLNALGNVALVHYLRVLELRQSQPGALHPDVAAIPQQRAYRERPLELAPSAHARLQSDPGRGWIPERAQTEGLLQSLEGQAGSGND